MKNPINYSLKTELFSFIILFAAAALSFWAYPLLPDLVVSHWGLDGRPNGWSSREFHCLFFPALMFVIYFAFVLMPKFDPQGERYQEFAGAYRVMRDSILFLFFIVFVAATFSNLGYNVNIGATVSGAVGIMMIVLGNYFGKLKRNFFVGIKTPWTLSSENVWNKTHRLGSRLFIIWGLTLIIAPWLDSKISFLILIGGLIVIVAWPMIYSYSLYKKEKK